jgi:hypothetical protein
MCFFSLLINSSISITNILFSLANLQNRFSSSDVEINFIQAYYNTNIRINIAYIGKKSNTFELWLGTLRVNIFYLNTAIQSWYMKKNGEIRPDNHNCVYNNFTLYNIAVRLGFSKKAIIR